MAWLYLGVAGLLEVAWATLMKESHGFTKLAPTALMAVAMVGSFWLLALAMRSLPLGTAYAIWTGIGAVGAFLVGIAMMGEPVTAGRLLSAALLLAGMIGLKLTSGH
ncbi:multidrug efflux SMR transporter [Nitratireductor sp. ZSWI3]|uniref:DMT family transporter n=1 Tax=Nitratireductor sp. ZSWI3 TaxID=2966359 RepID=UPI00214FB310|nr:multidrug efflux SMR transporter [Nitratireductor sp. ZSWI3]MCR4267896.1 multidrug efflux SMR transporter [Nitratireductor sp. ZSWI3]